MTNSPEPMYRRTDVPRCYEALEYHLMEWVDAARNDADYQHAVTAFKSGKGPDSLGRDHPCQTYKSIWSNVSTFDHPFYPDRPVLVYDGNRIVVPTTCKRRILGILHRTRDGLDKTLGVAQQLYYWPGMIDDIRAASTHIEDCDVCRRRFRVQAIEQNRRSKQEPKAICHNFPALPFHPNLTVGTPVWVTRPQSNVLDDVQGVIQGVFREGRRYHIRLKNGQDYYRNSKFVRPISD